MAQTFIHASGHEAIQANGEVRLLTCFPTPFVRRMAFKPWTESPEAKNLEQTTGIPLIPRDKWKTWGRRKLLGTTFLCNQRSHGSCVAASSKNAAERTRALAGYSFQRLSIGYLYSLINGGSDNGANIGDGLRALQKHGTCLDSQAGWNQIYRRDYDIAVCDATANRFLVEEGFRIETFDEAGTANQSGFIVVYPVMVGNSFDNLNSDGVAGVDRGPGNHSVHMDDILFDQHGNPIFDTPNTWSDPNGPYWGIEGRFCTGEAHWRSIINYRGMDAYAIRSVKFDPNDPNQLPVAGP